MKEYIAALEQELSSVENGFNMSENPWAMLYEISVRNFRISFVKKWRPGPWIAKKSNRFITWRANLSRRIKIIRA